MPHAQGSPRMKNSIYGLNRKMHSFDQYIHVDFDKRVPWHPANDYVLSPSLET